MRSSATLPLPVAAAERISQRVTVRGGPLDSVVTSMRNGLQRLPAGSVVLHSTFPLDAAFSSWAWQVGGIFATASCVDTAWWDASHRNVRVVARLVWPNTEERVVIRVLETDEADILRRRMAILLTEQPSEVVPAAFPAVVWPSPAIVLEAVRVSLPYPLPWLAALHTSTIIAARGQR